MNEEILVPIFMFASIAVIVYKFLDVRHKERMTIIEKGLVNEDLKHLYMRGWKTNPYSSLKYGMLAAFIGVGILVSVFTSQMFFGHEEQITAGIIFLFGGVGLIAFYAIAKKRISEDEKQQS